MLPSKLEFFKTTEGWEKAHLQGRGACEHVCARVCMRKTWCSHMEKSRLDTNTGRLTPDGRFARLLFPSLTQVFISKYSIINT